MRILGFSKKWPKLDRLEFTTFRFPRGDKDWQVGEVVHIVIQPRRKGGGDRLELAEIIEKEKRWVIGGGVSQAEALADGFQSVSEMVRWISKAHKNRNYDESMNKLILRWVSGETTA